MSHHIIIFNFQREKKILSKYKILFVKLQNDHTVHSASKRVRELIVLVLELLFSVNDAQPFVQGN